MDVADHPDDIYRRARWRTCYERAEAVKALLLQVAGQVVVCRQVQANLHEAFTLKYPFTCDCNISDLEDRE